MTVCSINVYQLQLKDKLILSSSASNSTLLSWCNAGESLAVKDFSNSNSSSSANELTSLNSHNPRDDLRIEDNSVVEDDPSISLMNTDMQMSTICKYHVYKKPLQQH